MDADTRAAIKARFADFAPRDIDTTIQGEGRFRGIRIRTTGWKYTISRTDDGFFIYPPNSSPRYVALVEMLMEALLEAHHIKTTRAERLTQNLYSQSTITKRPQRTA